MGKHRAADPLRGTAPQKHFKEGKWTPSATDRENWMDVLRKEPEWGVQENFGGVKGVTLFSHAKFFACFLVMQNVCHLNYDMSYNGMAGGAWYSRLGYDLSKLAGNEKFCRGPVGPFSIPSFAEINIRGGKFLSVEGRDEWIEREEEKVPEEERWDGHHYHLHRAIIAHMDPFPGHIVYDWAMLADFQYPIWLSLGKPPENQVLLNNLTYYFPAVPPDNWQSTFMKHSTVRCLKLLFGEDLNILVGKGNPRFRHTCVDEAIFPVANDLYIEPNESMTNFKRLMYAAVAKPPAGLHIAPPPLLHPIYQVTWFWRTSRRTIANTGAMLEMLIEAFTDFPQPGEHLPIKIVEFDDGMPLEEIIQIMRHTAFSIGMHGQACFQETFSPVGSHHLELMPYKLPLATFQTVGRSLGVNHTVWVNTHPENSTYDDNCFLSEWHQLSAWDCWQNEACFVCAKDHPITVVHLGEVGQVIENLKPGIRQWIMERRSNDPSLGSEIHSFEDER
eukprot:TRINITY_DN3420_c0_g1_i1.p1 TRINITY_DN3420_c0_g1~~TRINITY_DN3420_c0_g1_i1.p1  ORF type:complete len:502 (-),score=81.50 TRINITY_DN3420_c0_g1_i1:95-1600(-)